MADYTAVEKDSLDEIIEAVNELIQQGYLPHGGICMTGRGINWWYCQALLKED